ncbi:hypothetical protein K0U83_21530 [bacterium]|nr:hypothetical protein [bacterium]
MAVEQAVFQLRLDDGVSATSKSAANALAVLQDSIKKDTKALSEMQSAMRRLQAAGSVDVATFRDLQKRIDTTKKSLADAQTTFIKAGGSFSKSYKKGAEKGLKDMASAARDMPGPIGAAARSLESLGGTFGKGSIAMVGGVAAIAAVVAGFAMLVGAAAQATAAIARYALAVGDARRNESLHFEAISRMRRGFGMAQRASSEQVVSAIDSVAASSATSRESIAQFAETLQRGGVRGENFRVALQAAATRAAALGDESGQAFANMARGASRAGVSIRRLADDVQARFGGIAQRRLLSLDVIGGKLRESFAGIFSGLNMEPFLGAMAKIAGYFSQTHVIGRALREVVTALFQPMVDSAENGVPLVKRLLQGLILTIQQVTINILSLRLMWKRFSEGSTLPQGRFRQMGVNAVMGISQGITQAMQGAASPTGLMGVLAQSMGERFAEALDIHSPSRVFAGLGRQIPAGVAVGIGAGTNEVDAAVAEIVSTPSASNVASGASSSTTTNARTTNANRSIQIGTINVTGGGDAASIGASIRDALADVLSGMAAESGVAA